ncbi:MAG: lanthionine synthetase LanC family protein [Bacteroidota bacterium]
MDNRFLKEAIKVGDRLVEMAKTTEHGVCWESLSYHNGTTSWQVSESIYSGSGGIAYYLMELYEATKDEKYLSVSIKAIEELWHVHQTKETDYYAFFTGRAGLSYVFLKTFDITADPRYKDWALEVALKAEENLDSGATIDDLINGLAGTIVGLLHAHEKLKDERLIPIIGKYAEKLLNRANFTKEGISWDRSHTQVRGLCGFSHGTAGVGYAFLLLGSYFNNPAFYFIAEMAFAYENQFFREQDLNWPDFRKGFFDEKSLEEYKEEYRKGNRSHFVSPGSMKAWCHGSPGIGLSRITAVKILGDKYKADLENAVRGTMASVLMGDPNLHTYTLCHGAGGNSLLLMEAASLFPDIDIQPVLEKVADNAIQQFENQGFYTCGLSMHSGSGGTSLFMGDAGVGYYMLALAQGYTEDTILKPEVKGIYGGVVKSSFLQISRDQLIGRLASKTFPNTWESLNDKDGLDELTPENLYTDLENYITERIGDDQKRALQLEKEINELNSLETGAAYLYIRQVVELDRIRKTLEEEQPFDDLELLLPEEHKLVVFDEEDLKLLIPSHEGVAVHDLNFFTYLIISKFTQPCTVKDAVASIFSEFEVDDEEQMYSTVSEQARQALMSGIMFLAN